MVSRRGDYAAAKQYMIDLTSKYAENIIPDAMERRIEVRNAQDDWNGRGLPTIAYAMWNKDLTRALLVYDSGIIKANIYNIKSKFFNALAIHELCHIRHDIDEPGVTMRFHSKPVYVDCVKKWYPDDWAYKSETHPGRRSFRAYLGSDDKLVPLSINEMIFYICKDCRSSYLWNNLSIRHPPLHCESCKSEKIAWTHLKPLDVYRVAKINEIDFVEYTAPAIWNEA